MDLDDMTKSEMSLDQLADMLIGLISSAEPFSERPVEKIKKTKGIGDGTSTRIIWGKTSTCSGYKKFSTKLRYKRLKLLNKDFRRDSDFKEKFESANREAAHLRAGGQSRISHLKESVKEKDSKLVDLVAALSYFHDLRVYIHLVGDPKKTRAKVVTRKINGKKSVGVITKEAPDPLPRGVFKIDV